VLRPPVFRPPVLLGGTAPTAGAYAGPSGGVSALIPLPDGDHR
jgi:hypothetical protein